MPQKFVLMTGNRYICRMNELAKHIECLLLDNDCVVVPQFGGFVTRQVAAERIEDECLFLPPMRTVRFNPALQSNDGLLVRSLMKTYGTGESEAKRMLQVLVLKLRQTLLENASCDFGSLGVLTQDEDGEVSFSPCQAGTVCPLYYGLDALHFPVLETEREVTDEMTSTPEKQPFIKRDEKHITIRVNRRLINYVTATVAAVILFFMFMTPAQNTNIEAGDNSHAAALFIPMHLLPAGHTSEKMPEAATETTENNPIESVTESKALNDSLTLASVPSKVESHVPAPAADSILTGNVTGYCIVAASAVTEKNARLFVSKLSKAGISGAQVYKKGKMTRVIFAGFTTETDAYRRASELRKAHPDLASAWVHKL